MSIFLFLAITIFPLISECKDNPHMLIDFGVPVENGGVPLHWKLRVNAGEADTQILMEAGEPALYLRSLNASFALERELSVKIRDYPYLKWAWKALTIPPRGDLRKRSRNDQALQLLVAFEGGKILSYVWDANAPEGTVTDESIGFPLFITVKVIVVKSGTNEKGKWLSVSRNLFEDYKEIFGGDPGNIRGIRVQSNSQYTGGCAEGMVKRIVFSRHEATEQLEGRLGFQQASKINRGKLF
jgi:hypothetical protein